jgi:hypothetical protein
VRRRIVTASVTVTVMAVVGLFVPAALAIRDRDHAVQTIELQSDAARTVAQLVSGDPSTDPLPANNGEHRYARDDGDGRLLDGRGPATLDDRRGHALAGTTAAAAIGEVDALEPTVTSRLRLAREVTPVR